jgi:DNA polymerase-1
LATIRTDVPIALDENQLAKKEPNIEALTKLYQELEFNSLLKKLSPVSSPSSPSSTSSISSTSKASKTANYLKRKM